MLKYFGVNKDEVVILEVNNQEERKYLQGVATAVSYTHLDVYKRQVFGISLVSITFSCKRAFIRVDFP